MDENLLGLLPGERLWKLYCFHAADHPAGLRHRIYTKVKKDGRLELLTFAAHDPLPESTGDQRRLAPTVRSALARVPNLSTDDLERLIAVMRAQTSADICAEIDLSLHPSLSDQEFLLRSQENA
jgi:hypothetical protein